MCSSAWPLLLAAATALAPHPFVLLSLSLSVIGLPFSVVKPQTIEDEEEQLGGMMVIVMVMRKGG